jgi:hypothetical protein
VVFPADQENVPVIGGIEVMTVPVEVVSMAVLKVMEI